MSQVSRPVQIALVVVVLAGALWFLALRPHPPSGTGAQTPAPVATTPAPSSKAPGSSLPLGVGGLARAVDKAHGAVNTAQAQANTLQRDSGAASCPTGTPVTTATATASAPPTAPAAGAATPPAATATGTHAGTGPRPPDVHPRRERERREERGARHPRHEDQERARRREDRRPALLEPARDRRPGRLQRPEGAREAARLTRRHRCDGQPGHGIRHDRHGCAGDRDPHRAADARQERRVDHRPAGPE